MMPQTIAHLVIIGFIILGNIFYFFEKMKKKS